MAASDFQVSGTNARALFTLKLHRGDGMCLIAMNWKQGKPPDNFVGFAIESRPPDSSQFFALRNRIGFKGVIADRTGVQLSTLVSPIQKFRWIHFPRNANLDGPFTYRVTPVFMDAEDRLSQGDPQEASIELRRETHPGQLNVTFTRGFVSAQAFVDRFESAGRIKTLLPGNADAGLKFKPTHPKTEEALAWMGFEAREAILELLDTAIKEKAAVRVVAYDLSEPEVVKRLVKLKKRLQIIIDNSDKHGKPASGESQAAKLLRVSAGSANVKRQHMRKLQHNKMIIVDGPTTRKVVFGSTNLSWRGLYVQANNAMIVEGRKPVDIARAAFDNYWNNEAGFPASPSAQLVNLGLPSVDARVAFSPHSASNALLAKIGEDIDQARSSLFYSLAFLAITPGVIRDAIKKVSARTGIFAYGMADRRVGGMELRLPNGNIAPVFPGALEDEVPMPFRAEVTGGGGNRMHHKFIVIDFDKPDARVYMGSYNFSKPADRDNGENLVVIRDRRVAVSYMVEALRIFDHYHYRVIQRQAGARTSVELSKPPRKAGEKPWFADYYTSPRKIRDREIFS